MATAEACTATNPHAWDTDGDGISDGYELAITHTNPGDWDNDSDGWSDDEEDRYGTSPNDAGSYPCYDRFTPGCGDPQHSTDDEH